MREQCLDASADWHCINIDLLTFPGNESRGPQGPEGNQHEKNVDNDRSHLLEIRAPVLRKGAGVLAMMSDVFDQCAASWFQDARDLTNGLITIGSFVEVMNHGIRNDDVKQVVNERQVANISRLHRDAFRHSLSPRIFQYGFRAVSCQILGLPDVDTRCPASREPFCSTDHDQAPPATHIKYLFVAGPRDAIQEPFPA